MRSRFLFSLLMAAGLLLALGCSSSEEPALKKNLDIPASIASAPRPGSPAPDFALTTLDGRELRLSELRGKVVVINIWATWCPPCREELPSMVKFYETYRDKGVEIIAVSEDMGVEEVQEMAEKLGMLFPTGLDQDKAIYNLYRATGVPETHLVDKNGVIQGFQLGPFDWTSPVFTESIDRLLAQ